jgi:uncharacterized protein with PQ loop repeat
MRIIQAIGMLSGIIMPLFNIPLILRIIRRRSSGDISLVWVIGVWSCVIAMLMAHECTTLKRANLRFSILNPGDP